LHSLPPEGVPASLGPGLRTASGAKRSLGEKLSPSAVCPMTGESTNSQTSLSPISRDSKCTWPSSRSRSTSALATRVEWLKARADTFQAEVTDRSAWDWYADSCPCGRPGSAARADLRLPRRGLAGCRQLDPSHQALVTCEDANVDPCQRLVEWPGVTRAAEPTCER
jgi:hypothetical protein